MPENIGTHHPRTWKAVRIIGLNLLIVTFLFGCILATSFLSPTQKPDPSGPGILWRETETPLFPTSWPPTSDTVWVSYTFAYGDDPVNLHDGSYVTAPLAKTEWKADGSSATKTLNTEKSQAAIQGVSPLDEDTLQILKKGKPVSETCLKLAALPDAGDPAVKEMLAYYRAWFKYNGAFLGLIRADHAGFIDWVNSNAP